MRQRLEELEGKARAILDGQDDVLTMITKYVRAYFEFFDHNQHLYRLIVQERLDVGVQVQDLYLKQVKRRKGEKSTKPVGQVCSNRLILRRSSME